MGTKLFLKAKPCLDFGFTYIPLFFATIWTAQSLHSFLSAGLYGSTDFFLISTFTGEKLHSFTVINLCLLYAYTYYSLNYLPPPVRFASVLAVLMLPVTAGGIVWNSLDHLARGGASPLVPILFFISTLILHWTLASITPSRSQRVLRFQPKRALLLLPLYFFSIYIFTSSHFFPDYDSMLKGAALDPHNWEWGLFQLGSIWVWLSVMRSRV